MATNELQAKITADITGLKKGLSDAQKLQEKYRQSIAKTEKELKDNIKISAGYENAIAQLNREYKEGTISQTKFQKSLERLQRDEQETKIETTRLRKELNSLKKDYKDLSTSSATVGKSMSSVKKNTANATPTLVEFSRVIQDAPYGIQGVANNIQQLTTQFTYLKKNAGGTIPALKSLVGSFAGPAGMIFAVSTVTSLLVTFGDELFKTSNKAETLDKKLNDLTDAFDAELKLSEEIQESLELQGKSTAGIIAERKKLINEQINSLANLINEQREMLKIKQLENQRVTTWEALTQEGEKFLGQMIGFARVLGGMALDDIANLFDGINPKILNAIIPGLGSIKQLQGEINKLTEDKSKYEAASAEDKAEELKLQTKLNNLLAQQQALQNDILKLDIQSTNAKREIIKPLENSLKSQGISLPELKPEVTGISGDLGIISEEQTNAIVSRMKRIQTESLLLNNVVSSAMNGLTSSLAESLQTGNAIFDSIVQGFIKTGATLLQEMIAQSIAGKTISQASKITTLSTEQAKSNANAITVATSAAAALGPAGAIALPGLIASQLGLVNSAFAPLYAFAQGGIVPGGSYSGDKVPAFLNSGEMVLNNSQQSRLFSILDGNLNTLQGNQQENKLVASTILRGADLYLAIEREKRGR